MHNIDNAWKDQILSDFSRWIEALPDGPPGGAEAVSPACDMHSLFSAFIALRQEVRLQNREQARAVRGMEKAVEACDSAAALFRSRSEALGDLEVRTRHDAERRCLLPFLEMRDALMRGLEAAQRMAQQPGFFRRPPVGIEGVAQGYVMAIERFDRTMGLLGVTRVQAVGHRFDPRTMAALEMRTVEGAEDEEVLEESLIGFARGDEVLRPAEVIVNRRQNVKG